MRVAIRWGGGGIGAIVILALAVAGCRGADPSHGPLPHRERIYRGPALSAAAGGTFVATNADVAPIQALLRADFGVGGDVFGSGISWAVDGQTEEFDPRLPTPRSGPNTRALATPVAVGSLVDLTTEVGRFALAVPSLAPGGPTGPAGPSGCSGDCADGTTLCDGLCLATASDPFNCGGCGEVCDATEVCADGACGAACAAGTTSCLRACVDTTSNSAHCGACGAACPGGTRCVAGSCAPASLTLPDLVDDVGLVLAMDETRVRWANDPRPSAPSPGNATLQLDIPLRVQADLDDLVDALFDVDEITTPFRVDVTAEPCGTGLDRPCTDSGVRTFDGYRSVIARGLGYLPDEADVRYPAQGLNFTSTAAPHCDETAGRVRYTAGCLASIATEITAVIGVLGADAVSAALLTLASIARGLGGTPGALAIAFVLCDQIAGTIEDLVVDVVAALPPQLDAISDLLINPPTLAPLLTAANFSTLDPALDRTPFLRGRALVQLDDASGAELTAADGAQHDAFLTALATGGASVTPAAITLDLEPTIHWCARERVERGEGPRWDQGCGICTPPSGLCTTALAPAECACICDAASGQIAARAQIHPPPVAGLDCAGDAADPIALPPTGTPLLAALLSGAPVFAESVRHWFASPLPPGARYVETRAAFPGALGLLGRRDGFFRYIVDPDDDFISSEVDLCPAVFDAENSDDGDGDRHGAACDLCPGVADSRPMANGDVDGDGIPNGCDCDADGDGCTNAGSELSGGGADACVATGGVFDRLPFVAGTDFDGDGTSDDCDLDRDGDGVPDAIDNCPLGDGDAVFEPGTDTDSSQADANDDGTGDLCDRVCPPNCDPPGGGGGGGGAGGGAAPDAIGRVLDHLAGVRACAGLSGSSGPCDLQALLECEGFAYDRCWDPNAHDALVLVDDLGLVRLRVDPAQAGLDGGISANAMLLWDLDGDDFDDFAVAAPRSSKCPQGGQGPILFTTALALSDDNPPPPPEPCAAAGAVGFVSSRTGALLGFLSGPGPGARFGEGMAVQGDTLAIGAPGVNADQGAVFVYRLAQGAVELRAQLVGDATGDGFGSTVAPALDARAADPSFLVGAPGAHGGDGELALLDGSRGVWARFPGPVPGARMAHGIATPGLHDRTLVVGAAPDAFSGAGALAFFTMRPGRARHDLSVYRGRAASRLGESLVAWSRPSGTRVVAGAPGGRGSVLAFDLRGRLLSRTGWVGHRFGLALSAPGDLNGDGLADLLIGYAADAAGDDLLTLQVFELSR